MFIWQLSGNEAVLVYEFRESWEDAKELGGLIDEGKTKPHMSQILPLDGGGCARRTYRGRLCCAKVGLAVNVEGARGAQT